jgi:hypothetical protein
MIIIAIIYAKSIELNYRRTRTHAHQMGPVVPLLNLHRKSYVVPYINKNF